MVRFGRRKVILVIVSLIVVIIVVIAARIILVRLDQRIQQEAAVLFQQGEQMRLTGKYQEAVHAYEEILQKYSGYGNIAEVRFKLANVLLHQLNNIPQAKEQYTALIATKKKYPLNTRMPEAMIELAIINRFESKYKEAIALYSRVLSEYPDYGDKRWLYFQLEMLYGLVGDQAKSKEMNMKRRTL